MRYVSFCVFAAFAASVTIEPAHAGSGTILLNNGSFTNPTLTSGSSSNSIPGWTLNSTQASTPFTAQVINPSASDFAFSDSPYLGQQFGFLSVSYGALSISQSFSAIAGFTYTASIVFFERESDVLPASISLGFIQDSVLHSAVVSEQYLGPGNYLTAQYTYTAQTSDALSFVIAVNDTTSASSTTQRGVAFTNAAVATVPAPGALALLPALAALGLTVARRRTTAR